MSECLNLSVVTYRILAADYVNELVQCIHRLMPTLRSLESAYQQLLNVREKYRNLRVTCQSLSTEWHGIASIRSQI